MYFRYVTCLYVYTGTCMSFVCISGADRCSVVTLLYDNGAMAQLTSHSAQLLTNRASIYGTKGAIHVSNNFRLRILEKDIWVNKMIL